MNFSSQIMEFPGKKKQRGRNQNEIIQGKFPDLKDTNFQIERAHFNRLKLSYTKAYNCEILNI